MGLKRTLDAQPYEVLSAVVAVLLGIITVFSDFSSNAARTLLGDGILLSLWGAYLTAGGLCVLIGVFQRVPSDLLRGFTIERLGLGALCLGYLVYGVAVINLSHTNGIPLAAFLLATAVAHQRRAVFLERQRREVMATRALLGSTVEAGGHSPSGSNNA